MGRLVLFAALAGCTTAVGLDKYRPCARGECDGLVDAVADAGDAATGDAATGDAPTCVADQPGYCCTSTPFDAPTKLGAPVNLGDDGYLRFAGDPVLGTPTYGVFTSTRNGGPDIFATTFDGKTFTTPTPLVNVNSPAAEYAPTLSADGLTLIFNSNRGGADYRLYASTRASTSQDFPAAVEIAKLSGPPGTSDIDPTVVSTSAGFVLYFSSDRAHAGQNLYRTVRAGSGWSPPALIFGAAQSTLYDVFAAVTPDERVMYYHDGNGDVRLATAPTAMQYDKGVVVPELQTGLDTAPSYLTADRCTLYFTRKPAKNVVTTEIWVAKRSRP